MKNILKFAIISLAFSGCNSKTDEAEKVDAIIQSQKVQGKNFFDYDEIVYNFNDFDESKLQELLPWLGVNSSLPRSYVPPSCSKMNYLTNKTESNRQYLRQQIASGYLHIYLKEDFYNLHKELTNNTGQ